MTTAVISMRLTDFEGIEWLEPWREASGGLEAELAREVGAGHPLSGCRAVSVGRRDDRDDVLFFLPDNLQPLAVVHLTWTGGRESNPQWPRTTFYSSVEDWVERRMRPDHLEFTGF